MNALINQRKSKLIFMMLISELILNAINLYAFTHAVFILSYGGGWFFLMAFMSIMFHSYNKFYMQQICAEKTEQNRSVNGG